MKFCGPSLVILWATTVVDAQFGPPPQAGCALIIPGPARSSAFDQASSVFGGPSGFSQSTCITYEAVNAAFAQAREQVGLPAARTNFPTEEIGNLGMDWLKAV